MKAAINQDYLFSWYAPAPLADIPTATLTLVDLSTVTSALSNVRADRFVSAIASDRRSLTLTAGASSAGLIGPDLGRAYLVTEEDGSYAVNISRLDGISAILSDPLPRNPSITTNASLQWAGYTYNLAAASNTAAGVIGWSVSYTLSDGDAPNREMIDRGSITCVRAPFDTGLDHNYLTAIFPQVADMLPRRAQDWAPQIKAAENELIILLRDDTLPSSVTEDDILNPTQFLEAHSYLTLSRIYETSALLDIAETHRERAIFLINQTMRSVYLDYDGDGIADAGEINIRQTGGLITDVRGSFSLPSIQPSAGENEYAIEIPRTRGMRH